MLGIFLIYWLGNKFYKLAEYHGRSKWGYTLLGLAVFYGSQFLLGIVLTIMYPDLANGLTGGKEIFFNLVGVGAFGHWSSTITNENGNWKKSNAPRCGRTLIQSERILSPEVIIDHCGIKPCYFRQFNFLIL